MEKPRMIGMNKTFVPNSKADQMKNKRFKRKGNENPWKRINDGFSELCKKGGAEDENPL